MGHMGQLHSETTAAMDWSRVEDQIDLAHDAAWGSANGASHAENMRQLGIVSGLLEAKRIIRRERQRAFKEVSAS